MALKLPTLAPVPPLKFRVELGPEEWQACLEAWITLAELYLRLPADEFKAQATDDGPLTPFLISYFKEASDAGSKDVYFAHPTAVKLSKVNFRITHRILSTDKPPPLLLQWDFLANLTRSFAHSKALSQLLHSSVERNSTVVEHSLQKFKNQLIQALESGSQESAESDLQRLAYVLKASPEIGRFFMTGSDFLDSMVNAYGKTSPRARVRLAAVAYCGLSSLLKGPKPNYSLLSDHLYSLKSQTNDQRESLLADLVTNTSILSKIRERTSSSEGSRAHNIAASLDGLVNPGLKRASRAPRAHIEKGKQRATDGNAETGELHFHKMGLVSQVQDLFPDLGSGFVVKLLDEYDENVELVTAHLLEDNLPPHLQSADRREQISHAPSQGQHPHFTPTSTPPPTRKNIYDDDEFDRLAVDMSRIHFGRKDQWDADTMLSDRTAAPNKAAIMSALAAFDSDDDERDDTYDVEDVGGMINAGMPGSEDADADLAYGNEEVLVKALLSTPEVFQRDAETRRGAPRKALKEQTGMTDEALEGWSVMMNRNSSKLRKLEAKYSAFSGQQRSLPSTAYRGSPADSDAEGEDGDGSGDNRVGHDSDRGRGGKVRGRAGRAGGRGGRGGRNDGTVGPESSEGPASGSHRGNTQVNRAQKVVNKASRANHNRRDQRARKMARGGFA